MFSVIHDPSVSKICHIQHHYMLAGIVWCGGVVFCIRCAFEHRMKYILLISFFLLKFFSFCISLAKSTNTQNNNHIKQGNGSFDWIERAHAHQMCFMHNYNVYTSRWLEITELNCKWTKNKRNFSLFSDFVFYSFSSVLLRKKRAKNAYIKWTTRHKSE